MKKFLVSALLCVTSSVFGLPSINPSVSYKLPDMGVFYVPVSVASNKDGTFWGIFQVQTNSGNSSQVDKVLAHVTPSSFDIKYTFPRTYDVGADPSNPKAHYTLEKTSDIFLSSNNTIYLFGGKVGESNNSKNYFFVYNEATGAVTYPNHDFGHGNFIGEKPDGTIFAFGNHYFTFKNGKFPVDYALSTSQDTPSSGGKVNDPGTILFQKNGIFYSTRSVGVYHTNAFNKPVVQSGDELYTFTIYEVDQHIYNFKLLHKFADTYATSSSGNGLLSQEGYETYFFYINKNNTIIGETSAEGTYGRGTRFKIENGVFTVQSTPDSVNNTDYKLGIKTSIEFYDGSIYSARPKWCSPGTSGVIFDPIDFSYSGVESTTTFKGGYGVYVDVGDRILGYKYPKYDCHYYQQLDADVATFGSSGSILVADIPEAPVVPDPVPPQEGPAPVINFSASNLTVNEGDTISFSWNATNATSCVASGDWNGVKGVSGTYQEVATNSKGFGLTCNNDTKQAYSVLDISVVPTPSQPSIPTNPTEDDTESGGSSGGSSSWFDLVVCFILGILLARTTKKR